MENAWSPWVFYTLDSGDKKRIERAGKDYVSHSTYQNR